MIDLLASMKITRVRFYRAPSRTMFNQSFHVCTVETDAGITGIARTSHSVGYELAESGWKRVLSA